MEIAYFCMSFLISLVTTAHLSFLLLSNSQTKLPFNAQALSFQLGLDPHAALLFTKAVSHPKLYVCPTQTMNIMPIYLFI